MNNTERFTPAPDAAQEQHADVIDINSREKIETPTQTERTDEAVNRVRSIADFKAQLLAQKPFEATTITTEAGTKLQTFDWNSPAAPAEIDTVNTESIPTAAAPAESAPTASIDAPAPTVTESEPALTVETNETVATPETNEQEAIEKALETVRKAGYAVTRIVEQQSRSDAEPASRSVGAILESGSSATPDTTPDRDTLLGRLSGFFAKAQENQKNRIAKRLARKQAKLAAKELKQKIKADKKTEKEADKLNRQLEEHANLQAFMKQRAARREQMIANNKERNERNKTQRDLERQEVKDLGKNILSVFRRNASPTTEAEPTGAHSTSGNENAESFADMMARKSAENAPEAPAEVAPSAAIESTDAEQLADGEKSPAYRTSTGEALPLKQTPAQYTAAEFNPNEHYPGFSQEELDASAAKAAAEKKTA